jgi:DNA-binding transcriptional LysR family regulator
VDLVIAERPPAGAPFTALATLANRLVIVAPVPPGEAKRKTVSAAELAERTWLLREAGSGTRATTDELLQGLDIAPPTLTLGSNGAVVNGVLAGLGITLISHDAVADYLQEGTLQEWRFPSSPSSGNGRSSLTLSINWPRRPPCSSVTS